MRCWLCGKPTDDGITIKEARICPACEQSLVHINVEDPEYDEMVNRVKVIWFGILGSEFNEFVREKV